MEKVSFESGVEQQMEWCIAKWKWW